MNKQLRTEYETLATTDMYHVDVATNFDVAAEYLQSTGAPVPVLVTVDLAGHARLLDRMGNYDQAQAIRRVATVLNQEDNIPQVTVADGHRQLARDILGLLVEVDGIEESAITTVYEGIRKHVLDQTRNEATRLNKDLDLVSETRKLWLVGELLEDPEGRRITGRHLAAPLDGFVVIDAEYDEPMISPLITSRFSNKGVWPRGARLYHDYKIARLVR